MKHHEIRDYYHKNSNKFLLPEAREAKHILITINDDFEDNTRKNAFRRISAIERVLKKDPELFEQEAAKHSECPSALKGGDLGPVKRGTLFPAIEKALFTMKPFDISRIIESDFGFHLIRCEKVHSSRILEFPEVKSLIRKNLKNKSRKRFVRNWLQQLQQPEQ